MLCYTLKVIEIKEREGLIEHSTKLAKNWQSEMQEKFGDHPAVGEIRGRGFWQAIDFTSNKNTHAKPELQMVIDIAERSRDLGVIVGPIGTAIEIAPALTANPEQLSKCVRVLGQAISEIAKNYNLE